MDNGLNLGAMNAQTARALNDAPLVKCPKCGGVLWDETSVVKSIPGIYTGSSHDQIMPIPVLVCRKCGEVLPQMSSIFDEKEKDEEQPKQKQTIITDFIK